MIYEIWDNKASQAAHGKTAHMAKWHAVKADLFEQVVKSEWEEITR